MKIRETRRYSAGPDRVWQVVGDVGALDAWVPAIERSKLEGELRTATFAGGGGDAVERILELDAAGRTYEYEYVSGPLPLQRYRSRVSVIGDGDGSELVWEADFTSGSATGDAELGRGIAEIYRTALANLESVLGDQR